MNRTLFLLRFTGLCVSSLNLDIPCHQNQFENIRFYFMSIFFCCYVVKTNPAIGRDTYRYVNKPLYLLGMLNNLKNKTTLFARSNKLLFPREPKCVCT